MQKSLLTHCMCNTLWHRMFKSVHRIQSHEKSDLICSCHINSPHTRSHTNLVQLCNPLLCKHAYPIECDGAHSLMNSEIL